MSSRKRDLTVYPELEWAERQLKSWKEFIDSHPISALKDRKETKIINGKKNVVVVATVEQQGKFIQETLKNYLSLLKQVDEMRKNSPVETRSGEEIPLVVKKYKIGEIE